jgi:hypothetical protein
VLHAERRLVLVHQGLGLLHELLRAESVHLRAAGLLLQRPGPVLQRLQLRERHVHLSARRARLLTEVRADIAPARARFGFRA